MEAVAIIYGIEASVKKLLEKVTVYEVFLKFRFKSDVTISI